MTVLPRWDARLVALAGGPATTGCLIARIRCEKENHHAGSG
ncbi:hypothetical protein [Arthrobacter methylotrophus]